MYRQSTLIIILAVPALLMGCGGDSNPQTASVSGTITMDGSPVTKGKVVFYPTGLQGKNVGRPATAELDSSGTFYLSTYGSNDGAVLGDHNVTVLSVGGENANVLGQLDPSTVSVVAGSNNFDFTLKPPEEKKGRNAPKSPDLEEPEDDE